MSEMHELAERLREYYHTATLPVEITHTQTAIMAECGTEHSYQDVMNKLQKENITVERYDNHNTVVGFYE